jgi:hypothetical protein
LARTQQKKPEAGADEAQRLYQTQKRLADALFGLFRTCSTPSIERVAQGGLLTLTGSSDQASRLLRARWQG